MKKYKPKAVVTAHEGKKDYLKHYGEGLFLRVRTSGTQSWLFSYQLPGSSLKFRMTLKGKNLSANYPLPQTLFDAKKLKLIALCLYRQN